MDVPGQTPVGRGRGADLVGFCREQVRLVEVAHQAAILHDGGQRKPSEATPNPSLTIQAPKMTPGSPPNGASQFPSVGAEACIS